MQAGHTQPGAICQPFQAFGLSLRSAVVKHCSQTILVRFLRFMIWICVSSAGSP